jgi:hypothetical protein
MERSDVEQWVATVVDALRPALLSRARMWDRLRTEAPPPEEFAGEVAALLVAHLTSDVEPGN